MKNKSKKGIHLDFFKGILLISYVFLLIYGIGYIFDRRLYTVIFHDDFTDAFMDFFNSASHAVGRAPYSLKAIYPPLCYVIYWIFAILMGDDAMMIMEQHEERQLSLLTLAQPMMVFLLYFSITLVIFCVLGFKLIRKNKIEKILLLIAICFSAPFLFQFERANIIFISLLGTMGFFIWKDSENKVLREIALMCLAFSAALKIYPAIFGILLIKEKRYKEASRLILYGILFFFLPFMFIRGGFKNVPVFIKNLIYTSTIDQASRDGYKLSFSASLSFILQHCSIDSILSECIAKKVALFLSGLSFISFWFQENTWKRILLLTLLLIGIPNMSYNYTAIFLCIPFILFLNASPSKRDKWIYGILFILMLFPIPFGGWFDHNGLALYHTCNRSFNTLQISFSILATVMLLNFETIFSILKKNLNDRKYFKVVLFVLISGSVFCSLIILGNKDYKNNVVKNNATVTNGIVKEQDIWFNDSSYTGIYKGPLKNNIPSGIGDFYPEDSTYIESIHTRWQGEIANGAVIIKYRDGSYQQLNCYESQIYGYITTYDSKDQLLDKSWYYKGNSTTDILSSAVDGNVEKIEKYFVTSPGTVFKISGNVNGVSYGKTKAKVLLEDSDKQQYEFSYIYSDINYGEYVNSPILQKGDNVTCFGTVNQIKNNVIYLSLISSSLNNGDCAKMNESYEDLVRYPCEYANLSCKIEGTIEEIQYDYINNDILLLINKENKYFLIKNNISDEFPKEYEAPKAEKKQIMDKICDKFPEIGSYIKVNGTYHGVYLEKNKKANGKPQIIPNIIIDNLKG